MAPWSLKSVVIRCLNDWKSSLSFAVLEMGVWSGVGGKTDPGKVPPIEFGAGSANPLSESAQTKIT